MEKAYATRVVPVTAMSLSSLRIGQHYCGEVVHIETGTVAWKSDNYSDERAARLQANRMALRYEHCLRVNGRRFEVEQQQKRSDFRARKNAAIEARKATREAAGELLAALALLDPGHPLVAKYSFPNIPTE